MTTTLRQLSSFGPGTYRGRKFTLGRLQAFVNGANKAIAAGVPVPLLRRHAKINANDEATAQFAKEEGVGWITKFAMEPDEKGVPSLAWYAKDVPGDVAKDIVSGKTRFTSPEFRPHYDCEKAGVYSGPMIRHMAFAYKPGNPHQGPITVGEGEAIALEELGDVAWQYAEDEKQPLDDSGELNNAEVEENVVVKKNPDMPPVATDASKMKAIIAGMSQLGVVLPSTFDLADPNSPDLMITGLNTAIKAKMDSKAEAAEEEAENEPPLREAAMPFSEKKKEKKMPEDNTQFSEEELAALPETLRNKVIATQERAVQFEEERRVAVDNAARSEAIAYVEAAAIPQGLKSKLLELYDVDGDSPLQFSEGEEVATFTAQQVVDMVAESLPPGLLAAFGEDTEESELPPDENDEEDEQFHERGAPKSMTGRGMHVTAKRARELVDASPIMGGSRRRSKSVSDNVADENRRVPNNAYRDQR